VLPTLAILIGFAFIVAGNKFLGRNDMYRTGIATMAGGGALILAGIWMLVARERRRIRTKHQAGFDILPPTDREPQTQSSNDHSPVL
jgi:hypothetical protein